MISGIDLASILNQCNIFFLHLPANSTGTFSGFKRQFLKFAFETEKDLPGAKCKANETKKIAILQTVCFDILTTLLLLDEFFVIVL